MKATKIFKLVMFSAVIFGLNIGTANAILITGGMGITGNYGADATTLTLNSAIGTSGTGDLSTVTFGTSALIVNGVIAYDPFAPVVDVLQIGGWQLDLTTLIIDPNSTTDKLKLSGTGVLSGYDFDATVATWTFSAQNASSYSMTITSQVMSVAEPTVLGLLALGFIGIGVGQRIRDRNKSGL